MGPETVETNFHATEKETIEGEDSIGNTVGDLSEENCLIVTS